MGRPGTVPDSGLSGRSDVVRRIAGDAADLTRAGESDNHRSFPGTRVVAPRLHGWIPMAADGSVNRWRRVFPCRSISKRGSAGIPCAALRRQYSLPSAGCLAALALCPRLAASALFRRSGRYRHRNLAQAPEHVGSNQQGRGRGCASGFGFGCLPSTPLSPVQ
jgi:hypothetical protein